MEREALAVRRPGRGAAPREQPLVLAVTLHQEQVPGVEGHPRGAGEPVAVEDDLLAVRRRDREGVAVGVVRQAPRVRAVRVDQVDLGAKGLKGQAVAVAGEGDRRAQLRLRARGGRAEAEQGPDGRGDQHGADGHAGVRGRARAGRPAGRRGFEGPPRRAGRRGWSWGPPSCAVRRHGACWRRRRAGGAVRRSARGGHRSSVRSSGGSRGAGAPRGAAAETARPAGGAGAGAASSLRHRGIGRPPVVGGAGRSPPRGPPSRRTGDGVSLRRAAPTHHANPQKLPAKSGPPAAWRVPGGWAGRGAPSWRRPGACDMAAPGPRRPAVPRPGAPARRPGAAPATPGPGARVRELDSRRRRRPGPPRSGRCCGGTAWRRG